MNGPISEACKLCGATSTRTTDHSAHLMHISGCRCGDFRVDLCDYEDFLTRDRWLNEASRRELSALLREQIIRHGPSILLQIAIKTPRDPVRGSVAQAYDELAATWPQSVAERLDRVLLNLAALSPTGGRLVQLATQFQRDLALVFARTDEEAVYHVKALIKLERLAQVSSSDFDRVSVAPAGWARVEELQSNRSSRRNPVFVAMWFGGDEDRTQMNDAWNAIHAACTATGWKAIRADTEAHNDFIMDKILGDIRRSPFAVADFTGNRNGVYIEAGFARGREIPVVHTCRADHFDNAHFDIKQINTIKWNTVEELREGVTQRIRGTIGEGPEPIPNPIT